MSDDEYAKRWWEGYRVGPHSVAHQGHEQPTLRDRFAMAALTGLMCGPDWESMPGAVTRDAYHWADYMLAARKPTP